MIADFINNTPPEFLNWGPLAKLQLLHVGDWVRILPTPFTIRRCLTGLMGQIEMFLPAGILVVCHGTKAAWGTDPLTVILRGNEIMFCHTGSRPPSFLDFFGFRSIATGDRLSLSQAEFQQGVPLGYVPDHVFEDPRVSEKSMFRQLYALPVQGR